MDMNTGSIKITQEILALISEIDEFKGAWRALGQLAPEQLSALKKVATIESIGSSTRIEGSKLSDQQVEILLNNLSIQSFETRDQQEVAGYAAVMNLIFQHHDLINLSESYILQLHRELLKYSEKDDWHKGAFKKSPNHVEAFGPNGESLGIVFETATPFETPIRMQQLISHTNQVLNEATLHPLLVIAVFVVEFLAIHPFQDGNGRLSRALTMFLLLRTGYVYAPFSSLESVIEKNKEAYYLALRQTQGTIRSSTPDWQPWIIYFLKALQQQKRNLESKIEREKLLLSQLPALSVQILELIKSRGRATVMDIVSVTVANRNTIKKQLQTLVAKNQLRQNGVGKSTWYTLT